MIKNLAGCANMIRMTSDYYVIYRNIVGNKRKGATFATYTQAPIIVDSNVCNDESFTAMDLSSFTGLKMLEVGDYSCLFVREMKMVGLKHLERVVIGKHCFNGAGANTDGHFYLKNCKRLRELKIGLRSFEYYTVCEIENVPSLEVIEMGELDEVSYNFCPASLELKSSS